MDTSCTRKSNYSISSENVEVDSGGVINGSDSTTENLSDEAKDQGKSRTQVTPSRKKRMYICVMTTIVLLFIISVGIIVSLLVTSKSGNLEMNGSCPQYTNIENGNVVNTTGSKHGDFIEIECDERSKLVGANFITCLSTGKWSATPKCILKNCLDFVIPSNMQIESKTNDSVVGNEILVSCTEGFKLQGNKTTICQLDESWSEIPTCKAIDCGVPEYIANAEVIGQFNSTYNSTFSVKCKEGYKLKGSNITRCSETAVWDELPTCEIVSCGLPDIPTYGSISYITGTSFQATVTIKCDAGSYQKGNSVMMCQANGHWTNDSTCINIDDCTSSHCGNGTCIDGINNYTCACNPGFTGTSCERDIDDCISSNCGNGTCIDGINNYTCACTSGYTGTSCERDIDDCISSHCGNGTCIDGTKNYTCACTSGYTGTSCERVLTDCYDLYHVDGKRTDGVYTIVTWKTHQSIQLYCDMTTKEGGWTVFQYRFNGSVDFYRNLTEYEHGFGNLNTEFWLGLNYIQEISSQGQTDLRINLESENETRAFEQFENFYLSPGPDFTLHLGQTTDSLHISDSFSFGPYHNGSSFSTFDRDVDSYAGNCAKTYKGGWWYKECFYANLNGKYKYYESSVVTPLQKSKMMFRRT